MPPSLPRFIQRLLILLTVGTALLWVVHSSSARLDRSLNPAGFGRGLLHGAIMPMSLPNLLLGQDVTIYAPKNTGRLYKLGYTAGVNGCGAVFFGFAFWRLTRWRANSRAK